MSLNPGVICYLQPSNTGSDDDFDLESPLIRRPKKLSRSVQPKSAIVELSDEDYDDFNGKVMIANLVNSPGIFQIFLRCKPAPYVGVELQLLQVEVQFSGEPMIRHSN